METKKKLLVALTICCLIDAVIPVPILGIVLIYVTCQQPPWFMALVREIYHTK